LFCYSYYLTILVRKQKTEGWLFIIYKIHSIDGSGSNVQSSFFDPIRNHNRPTQI